MEKQQQGILILVAVLVPFLVTVVATIKAIPADPWVEVDQGVKGGASEPKPPPADADLTGEKRWEAISGVDKAQAGSVLVKVEYVGPPIGLSVIDLSSQPQCAAVYEGKPAFRDETLVYDKAVPWALVQVTHGLPAELSYKTPPPRVLSQLGCAYRPHVIGLLKGQMLYVANADKTTHNVNLMASGEDENLSFNKTQLPGSDEFKLQFAAKGDHSTTCQIHSWMSAKIHVLDHPYFVTTNEQGQGVIKMLPPGSYTLSVWHESFTFKDGSRRVTVEAGKQATVTFQVQ